MRLFFGLVLGLVCAVSLARPDRNSFLNRTATNLDSVIAQLESDPEVTLRYERHYGAEKADILAYFKTLSLSRLKQPAVLQVYSVPPNGAIKMHVEKFRAGTLVYRDSSGRAVLIAKCGNPLTRGPRSNDIVSEDFEKPLAEDAPKLREVMEQEFQTAASNDFKYSHVPTVPIDIGPATVGQSAVPVVPAVAAPGLLNWLLAAGGIGGIFAGAGDGSTTVVPVPEPATLAVLGVGVAALIRRRAKR